MPSLAPNQVGRHLEHARKAAGLTQLALAKATGINRVQIVRMEAGRIVPRLDEVVRLAEVLKVPIEWFIAGRCMPTHDLRGIALELYRLGVRDLEVSGMQVPGACRTREEILVHAVGGDQPEPRIIEAIPFLLLQGYFFPPLVHGYTMWLDGRAVTRLAWLSEIALALNRLSAMPLLREASTLTGRRAQPRHLQAFIWRGEEAQKKRKANARPDSLGHPGTGNRSPIWKRWNISYAGTMDDFKRRTLEVHAAYQNKPVVEGGDW
jgi:transcriptional regulator with XRE-family HTH domain